eukprot:12592890-Prorocentrum_lima.AAC.1
MTSSLVGSEMCIRDSICVHTANRASARKGAVQPDDRDGLGCKGRGTVSYTHLTLPTICSV